MSGLDLRNAIVEHVRDIDPVARLTLHVLAKFADKNTHECFPSQETLAECVGVSDRTIRTALATLKQRGYIAVVGHRKVNKPGFARAHVLVYRIMVDSRKRASAREVEQPEACFRPSKVTTGSSRHDDRKHASADDRKPTSDKQIKENRSGNRPLPHADARGGNAPVTSFSRAPSGASGKKKPQTKPQSEDESALLTHYADAFEKHRGERPALDARELVAARRLLKHDALVKAKARVDVAFSKGQYFNGSLSAIARDPNAFGGKPRATNGANGINGAVRFQQPLDGWTPGVGSAS